MKALGKVALAALVYGGCSFLYMDLDPANWNMFSRVVCLCVVVLVDLDLFDKNEHR